MRFQCSSASRKFLNIECPSRELLRLYLVSVLFSEPKIPQLNVALDIQATPFPFQCSSASRKFLNNGIALLVGGNYGMSFSALQRAENSSILGHLARPARPLEVSVLFSEPKIPQFGSLILLMVFVNTFQCSSASRKFLNLNRPAEIDNGDSIVSVLFSEPKIPQLGVAGCAGSFV